MSRITVGPTYFQRWPRKPQRKCNLFICHSCSGAFSSQEATYTWEADQDDAWETSEGAKSIDGHAVQALSQNNICGSKTIQDEAFGVFNESF